jgi:hypothetical protein
VGVIEGISDARVNLYAVELDQRRHFRMKPDIESAKSAELMVIRTVNDTAVRRYGQPGPMLEVLARGKVNRSAARSANTVGTDAEDNRRTVQRFRNRNNCDQRMYLTDLRIVFQSDMKSRMQTIDQRCSYGGSIDLPR